MTTALYAVDRLEVKIAVLVADDDSTVEVARNKLPPRIREGSVLRVRVGADGPDWTSAEIDEAEQTRRMDEVRELLDELKRGDPGGDIIL